MSVEIALLSENHTQEYQKLLLSSDKNLLYVSIRYRNFLREVLNHSRDLYLVALQKGKILAALPSFLLDNKNHGNVLNSLPFFGSNGGIIMSPENQNKGMHQIALISEFKKLAKEHNAISSTLISNPIDIKDNFYDQHLDYTFVDKRIGQFTILPKKVSDYSDINNELMKMFHYKTRNSIRKAAKSGVKIYHDGAWPVIETLAKMHQQNLERIGGIAKPLSVFRAIYKCFDYDKDYRVYLAVKDETPIAGLLVLFFNRTAEYFIPATLYEHREYQPMSLILREAMIYSVIRKMFYWNWGGTWLSQKGVYNFKKRWGTIDYKYKYYTKLYDDQILLQKSKTIQKDYPYFYVLPFSKLAA